MEELKLEKYKHETIEASKLLLDPDNPRFLHLQLREQKIPSQEDMNKVIREEDATLTLLKAIRKEGVRNPIFVKPVDGKYLVLDGNRRTVVIRMLMDDKETPPEGVDFKKIPALILPANTPAVEVEVIKGVLQAGQRPWGRFNDAAYVYRLRTKFKLEYEDIADRLQLSVREVRRRIDDYNLFAQYAKRTSDTDPERFSYFADAPKEVREWFLSGPKPMEQYSELICPGSPNHKIRSVATKGGLRDFALVLKDKDALEAVLTDPQVTVEEALEIAEENNLEIAAPFLRRIGAMAQKIRALEPGQIEALKHQPRLKIDLEKLRESCVELLGKLREDDK